MKHKHRKLLISGTAVVAAGALGIGTLIQTTLSVQASVEMMPGIETIVDENSSEKPFRILELVGNSTDAELGYYVSGQEPSVKLYTWQYQDSNGQLQTMHFSSLAEGLQKLPTAKLRQEFAMNVRLNADGEIDISASTGIRSVSDLTGDNVPVSYSDYQEKYFLSSGDNADQWKKIDFTDPTGKNTRTDKVQVKGEYQENTAHTGDYTREEHEYYPIKGSNVDDSKEKYRENILNFYFSESDENSRGAYDLDFDTVTNETINKNLKAGAGNALSKEYDPDNGFFGLYENVYEDLTSLMAENIKNHTYTFPGENTDKNSYRMIYDSNNSPISQVADFSAGDIGDSADTAVDTESTPAEFGSDNSSQSKASSEIDNGDSVSFDNGFADSTGDISSDTSVDEWNDTESEIESEVMDAGDDFGSDFSDTDSGVADSYDESGIDDNTSDASDFTENVDDNTDVGESVDAETTAADEPVGDPLLEASVKAVQQAETNTQTNTTPETVGENPGKQENPYVYVSEQINVFPYYKYTKLGTLSYVMAKQEAVAQSDKAAQEAGTPITRQNGDIVLENDQYYYYKVDEAGTNKYLLTLVTGRQPVAYQDIQQIPENLGYDYYYRVNGVYFCCTDGDSTDENNNYKFTGWYYVNYQDQSNIYVQAENSTVATYYISDASYILTPGAGDFDFVPDDNAELQSVQVNHMYYNGGLINNDWFKKFVFHLQPKADASEEDGEFENFNIQVDTMRSDSSEDTLQAIYASASTDTSADAAGQEEASEDIPDISVDTDEENIEEAVADEKSDDFTDSVDMEPVEDAGEVTDSDVATEEDTDDQNEINVEEGGTDEAGDAETTEIAETTESNANPLQTALEGYDLIYVNGTLSSDMAAALEGAVSSNTLPCIINNARDEVTDSLSGNMKTDFVKADTEDADGHYVNNYVYFFKNTLDKSENIQELLNKDFNTTFTETQTEGFEEISSYIASENKYRELDKDESGKAVEKLSSDLSFARAIEYILNYKYKRIETVKSDISVLAIEPDKITNNKELKEDDVRGWLNQDSYKKAKINSVDVCCEQTTGTEQDPKGNAIDGDENTFWHSQWTGTGHSEKHWIKANFSEAQTVNTFEYLPRRSGTNGTIIQFNLTFYDAKGNSIKELSNQEFSYTNTTYNTLKQITFDPVENVSSVRVEVLEAFTNNSGSHASCAELGFYYSGDISTSPTVTNMTSSEYVGHIDDINSKYDMLYIGDGEGQTSFNALVVGDGDTLYTHVGGIHTPQIGKGSNDYRMMGLYPGDFNDDGSMNTSSATASFRGSGNDITNQQYNELMSFVKSGYPVVLGDKLVENDTVSSKVDNSSYMYKFLSEALKYDNVFLRSDLEKGNNQIVFLTMLSKPTIEFSENGKPAEAPRGNHSAGEAIKDESGKTQICSYNYVSGEMTYRFKISDEAAVLPAGTRYDCRLYFDLNFDGNLSESEEQASYMEIKDSSQNAMNRVTDANGDSHYELKAGEEYTVTRKLPSGYHKLIAWKLEIVNASNTNIRVSETGYSKQTGNGVKENINVLQIVPKTTRSTGKINNNNGTWDLKADLENSNSKLYSYVNNLEDFNVNVTRATVDEFAADRTEADNYLQNKQMVIIGFDDVYQNIKKDGVDALLEYIKAGKSVIFSHDTTSFFNYNYDASHNFVLGDDNDNALYNQWMRSNGINWGVEMNTVLREVVGMDRYGITNKTTFAGASETVSDLLKKGTDLTDGSGVSFAELMKLAGDVAYQSGSSGQSSYKQTQGYTNIQLESTTITNQSNIVTQATKVNDGAITQYPYVLDDISIAQTHGQYYQLALEQDKDNDGSNDIVVWYCLAGGKYDESPNDVRNNYYFYSKGNVIYTGAGHNPVTGDDEIKLFVNAMVAAANVAAVEPEVNFVKSLNTSAETESVRYYMTDQANWTAGSDEGNVLNKDEELYFNVKDYNMVSADLTSSNAVNMTVDFYIDSTAENAATLDNCPAAMVNKKVVSLNTAIAELLPSGSENTVQLGEDGTFHLTSNNAYGFKIPDIEQYLKKADTSYNENCTVYVKVTSTVNLYGKSIVNHSWASIDLKHRQLFDLD